MKELWEKKNTPITVGPKRVSGPLSDIYMHRVRTGNPSSLPQITNVRRWQEFSPNLPRFNGGERDLEVDYLRTQSRTLRLSPKIEALPNESFRASLVNAVAERRLPIDLRSPVAGFVWSSRWADNEETYHEFDLFKGCQILLVKHNSSSDDSPPLVPGRTLGFDRVLVMHANRHIFNPLSPHSGAPAVNRPPGDKFEPLLASRWVWTVIGDR